MAAWKERPSGQPVSTTTRGYSRPLGLSEPSRHLQPSEQPQARPEGSANKKAVALSFWVWGELVCYITTVN